MLQCSLASILPSKMHIFVAPCLLIPAQTDFNRVLGFGLALCRFANISVTSALVLFRVDKTYIAENNIMESVATLHYLLGILEPFNLVDISDRLAISSALQGPSLFVP